MSVESPCISVCRMDGASRLCEGCLRTLDEIACWGGMSDQEKLLVCDEIARRKRVFELSASKVTVAGSIGSIGSIGSVSGAREF